MQQLLLQKLIAASLQKFMAIFIEEAEFAKTDSDLFSVKDQFVEEGDDDDEK
jgi:hypothetical protein